MYSLLNVFILRYKLRIKNTYNSILNITTFIYPTLVYLDFIITTPIYPTLVYLDSTITTLIYSTLVYLDLLEVLSP